MDCFECVTRNETVVAVAVATTLEGTAADREAGLLRGTIDGPRVCYCVDREQLASLQQLVGDLVTAAAGPNDECCGHE